MQAKKNTGRDKEEDSERGFEGCVGFVLTRKEKDIIGMRDDMKMGLKGLL